MTPETDPSYVDRLCPEAELGGLERNLEVASEADVPAPQPKKKEDARIPAPHANGQRQEGPEPAPGQGATPSRRLILPHREGRLRSQKDFRSLYACGTAYRGTYLVLILLKNDTGSVRNAFVASSRVGGAVARNRAKRLMREAYRGLRGRVETVGVDLALIARPACREARIAAVTEELAVLYKRADLISSGPGQEGAEAR